MSVQFKPGSSAGSRATDAARAPRVVPVADVRRFANCLASPRDERDAHGDDNAARHRLSVAPAAAARFAWLHGRPGVVADALSWRLTRGRFAGLVVQACLQQGTLTITLVPANASQRALVVRHRARIEATCAARFAGPTIVN
ncbi:hypothetical protein WK92_01790 [Burkholderia ubonensis]|uniref:hypothetical protein n=1 Tax=Burkholderia ubonensis TaxID=101571 RepID=UPI000755C540|nr:hypothetical protein [Burkholderia ubonensis]KVV41083.1 hypothetical protein WK82_23950 [Burkholderia ubonensis]KVW14056.1 hypothetical protein WK92_01790 [Burkholderia ubonensis]KVW47299.1 hypothetical protein WK95_06240 [Burkholderia ubonensis]